MMKTDGRSAECRQSGIDFQVKVATTFSASSYSARRPTISTSASSLYTLQSTVCVCCYWLAKQMTTSTSYCTYYDCFFVFSVQHYHHPPPTRTAFIPNQERKKINEYTRSAAFHAPIPIPHTYNIVILCSLLLSARPPATSPEEDETNSPDRPTVLNIATWWDDLSSLSSAQLSSETHKLW